MISLFVDTNVFLKFYSFSKDHLDSLRQLVSLMKRKEIVLFLPSQIRDEFARNREAQLKSSFEQLDKFVTKLQVPVICNEFKQTPRIRELSEEIEKLTKSLKVEVAGQIEGRSLPADKLIAEIFELAQNIQVTREILDQARSRYDRGNPPGKLGSYGDSINWECLIQVCPAKEDLYFVGADKDFQSIIDETRFSPFLVDEWTRLKQSKIYYFQLISEFIKSKFLDSSITEKQIQEEKEVPQPSVPVSFGTSAAVSASFDQPMSGMHTHVQKTITCSNCGYQFTSNVFTPVSLIATGGLLISRVSCPKCNYRNTVFH